MLLFLTLLITTANAATCPLQDINLNESLLARYAADSTRLPTPKLLRTEENAEFAPDNPTTLWAMPTTGSTVVVKVHHAESAPSADGGYVTWVDTVLTIDPATKTVSGAEECGVLQPITEHVLEILGVIQEPGAPR